MVFGYSRRGQDFEVEEKFTSNPELVKGAEQSLGNSPADQELKQYYLDNMHAKEPGYLQEYVAQLAAG